MEANPIPQKTISNKPTGKSARQLDYKSLFHALPDPYIVFAADDPDFTIIEESEAHAAMSMVKRKDVIGKRLLQAYPDMSEKYRKTGVSDLLESIRRVIQTGKSDDMSVMRYDLKNVKGMYVERYFKVTHHPLFGAQADSSRHTPPVTAVVQVTADMTRPTMADKKLQETERQLAEALDIAQVGTWIWDLVGDKLYADKNLSLMFGLTEVEGAAGLPVAVFIDAIHPDDRQRVTDEIAGSIKRRELFDTEYRTIDGKGEVHWLLVRGRIETDASNKPIRFPGVLLDITERKQSETALASLAAANARLYNETKAELAKRVKLEDELRTINDGLEQRVLDRTKKLEAANADLNRSNQELQDFAYVASHDLQEPLRKIQAFGNLLEQEYAGKLGEGADYLHRMQKAAARMSSLISDLLSFSRVTTKVQSFEPVNLKTVALEVLDDLYARITETNGMVQVGDLPTIQADPLQMRQLLQNLVGNALKFHKPHQTPLVKVSAKTISKGGQQYLKLSVIDNGVGFDQKYTDRIFAVFQRLHGRDVYDGTGIGLAVCRKIVERHNGTITAVSESGKGSTFIVCLPVAHNKIPIHGRTRR